VEENMRRARIYGNGLDDLTHDVIGAAFEVSNTLGAGFYEKVYDNAMAIEMRERAIPATRKLPLKVRYHGELVGEFTPDFMVGQRLLVELKAVSTLTDDHLAQCLNYLRAATLPLCLLINFGHPRVEIRRVVNDLDESSR